MQSVFGVNLRANIRFGEGITQQLGKLAAEFGKTAMVITCKWPEAQREVFTRILKNLNAQGIRTILYDRAVPNPTSDSINEAAKIARKENVDFFIGLGGGSAMDTAKGAALMFGHPGSVWDYTYVMEQPMAIDTGKLKPVIAVTTTSGTGSQVTPYCVLQNPKLRRKTCVVANDAMIPTLSVVDPELMYSLPPTMTAATGFDVFAHAFEAYADDQSNPLIETLALEAIRITAEYLVRVYQNGRDREARYWMAYADTLAGMCIAMNNTTMPHDIGQAIVGKEPSISHGQSLAIIYPEYIDCALLYCEKKFAKIARIFYPSLAEADDACAARKLKEIISDWQKEIGVYASGSSLGLSDEVREAVVEETWQNCPFLTQKVRMNRNQIEEMMARIWVQ